MNKDDDYQKKLYDFVKKHKDKQREHNRTRFLCEGKTKIINQFVNFNALEMIFKDDVTAFNSEKHEVIEGKGKVTGNISGEIFKYLSKINKNSNHKIGRHGDGKMCTRRLDMIPIEVICRNITAGSYCERFNVERGIRLEEPVIEFCLKDDALGDPVIDYHQIIEPGFFSKEKSNEIIETEYCTKEQLDEIIKLTNDTNKHLIEYFNNINIDLVDFKLEFGFGTEDRYNYKGKILIGDEISPDNMRLWDKDTGESFDKDLFRYDKGDILEAYKIVYRRMRGWGSFSKFKKKKS